MSYLEQIKELGLEIITRAEFFKKSIEEGWEYVDTVRRWINISKGHPFCFIDGREYFSLDFLLESGIIVPKNYNVEDYLENRCTEYFIDKLNMGRIFKDE